MMEIKVILGLVLSHEFDLLQYIDKRNTDRVIKQIIFASFLNDCLKHD